MAEFDLTFKGINELQKFLKALPDNLQRRVTRQSLIASGKPIEKRMKNNLKKYRRTGRLIKAIKTKSAKRGRAGKEVVVFVGGHKSKGIDFSRDGFYGRFLENGTSKQPPRAWARPAVDSGFVEQRRLLAQEFGKRAIKEMKRNARKIIGF